MIFYLKFLDYTVNLENENDVSCALMAEIADFDEFDDKFILTVYRSAKGLENKVKLLKWLDENEDITKEDVLEKIQTLYK